MAVSILLCGNFCCDESCGIEHHLTKIQRSYPSSSTTSTIQHHTPHEKHNTPHNEKRKACSDQLAYPAEHKASDRGLLGPDLSGPLQLETPGSRSPQQCFCQRRGFDVEISMLPV